LSEVKENRSNLAKVKIQLNFKTLHATGQFSPHADSQGISPLQSSNPVTSLWTGKSAVRYCRNHRARNASHCSGFQGYGGQASFPETVLLPFLGTWHRQQLLPAGW